MAFSPPSPCWVALFSVQAPQRDLGLWIAQGVGASQLSPSPPPCAPWTPEEGGGLGRGPGPRPAHEGRRPSGCQGVGALSSLGLGCSGRLPRECPQLPAASLGWREGSEGFLWKKTWKRNRTGRPCLSHFLLPRQWVACLPLPAGVRRLFVVWAGVGAPLCCGVCPGNHTAVVGSDVQ